MLDGRPIAVERNRHVLLWFVAVLVVLAAIPTIFRFGPLLEAQLMPVIEMAAVGQAQTKPSAEFGPNDKVSPIEVRRVLIDGVMKARLLFKTDSLKHRACPLMLVSWRWYFDHQAEPAVLFFDDTDEQFRFGTALLTGPHISRPLRTDIPVVAFSYREITLAGTFFYQCHGLWPVPQEIRIHVDIPAPVDEQAPEAEPQSKRFLPVEQFARWF